MSVSAVCLLWSSYNILKRAVSNHSLAGRLQPDPATVIYPTKQKQYDHSACGLFNSSLAVQLINVAMDMQTPQGWTLSFDCTTFPEDHWGLLLPQLSTILQRWSFLSAAENAQKHQQQTVICSRKGQDETLQQLAERMLPAGNPADAASSPSSRAGEQDGDSSSSAMSPGQQQDMQSVAEATVAAGSAMTDAVVLELGWEVFKPKASDDEEEEEPPVVDFLLTVFNLQVCYSISEIAVVLSQGRRAAGSIHDCASHVGTMLVTIHCHH